MNNIFEPVTKYTIIENNEEKEVIYDPNPFIILNDKHCKEVLEKILKEASLDEKDKIIIEKCIQVTLANKDDIINFGPEEILGLHKIANKNPKLVTEIVACYEYLNNNVEYQGEKLPLEIYDGLIDIDIAFADLLQKMLK